LRSRESVRVSIRKGNRGSRLPRQLGKRLSRPSRSEDQAGRAPAQQERNGMQPGKAGQLLDEQLEAVRIQLRAHREGSLDPVGEPIGASYAEQMRAVDVHDVQSQRSLRQPLGLGDELLGQDGGCDEVEDVDRIEWDRLLAPEGAGTQEAAGVHGSRSRFLPGLSDEIVAMGEVPVDRRTRHSRSRGDVLQRGRRRLGEEPPGSLQDPLSIAPRVLAPLAPRSHATRFYPPPAWASLDLEQVVSRFCRVS
jgi:hypothetical protein